MDRSVVGTDGRTRAAAPSKRRGRSPSRAGSSWSWCSSAMSPSPGSACWPPEGSALSPCRTRWTPIQALAEAQCIAILDPAGVRWRFEAGVGDPACELMRVATDLEADTIVVAGRRHGALGGFTHGSVSVRLLHRLVGRPARHPPEGRPVEQVQGRNGSVVVTANMPGPEGPWPAAGLPTDNASRHVMTDGPTAVAADPASDHYKWIALSNTTLGHPDGDDQPVHPADLAARHLPGHRAATAGPGQHLLFPVDPDGLHAGDRGAGGQLRAGRRHVRPGAHVQPRLRRLHRLLDPAVGHLDDRARRRRCGSS